jgi:hypothetical protein
VLKLLVPAAAAALFATTTLSIADKLIALLPGDIHVVRMWDCSANYVSKGWAMDDGDCDGMNHGSARAALERHIKYRKEFANAEVVNQIVSHVNRGGIVRSKVWTVYDFHLRIRQSALPAQ